MSIFRIAAAMLANAAMTSVLALYLGAEFGVTESTIGYVFLYVGIFSVAMRSASTAVVLGCDSPTDSHIRKMP